MKKFNLLQEIVVVERAALMQAINSAKAFGITHKGEIVYLPSDEKNLYIFKGTITPAAPSVGLSPQKPKRLGELLGSDYRIVEDDERVLIKAGGAWQSIIGLNIGQCDYDDTSGDGIDKFTDSRLEDIGWHATEFNITYREIVEAIEVKCEGILFCIENEGEHYQFSGLGFIDDIKCARDTAFAFCLERVRKAMAEEDEFAPDSLTDDEAEAAEFFGVL